MRLFDITTYASIVYAGAGGYYYSRIATRSLHVLIIFVLIQVSADLALVYLFPIGDGQLIRIVYSILKPVEYASYAYVFSQRINSRMTDNYARLSIVGLVMFSVAHLFIHPASKTLATNIVLAEGILMLILVLLYFRYLLTTVSIVLLSGEPLFWMATGLLFFYAGNVVSTGFYFQLKAHVPKLASSLYILNYILSMLNYLLSGFAFFIASKKHRTYA